MNFDSSRDFNTRKLTFLELKNLKKRFLLLMSFEVDAKSALAQLMIESLHVFTLTDAIELSNNRLSFDDYFNLYSIIEDFKTGASYERTLKIVKEIESNEQLEEINVEIPEDANYGMKDSGINEALVESKPKDTKDLKNEYTVVSTGVKAKIPEGYIQKILTFDEMVRAKKIYSEAIDSNHSKTKALYFVMEDFKNILLPSDVKFIGEGLSNSDIYSSRLTIDRRIKNDTLINSGLKILNHKPIEGALLEELKEYYKTMPKKKVSKILDLMKQFDLIFSREDALKITENNIDDELLLRSQKYFLKSKGVLISHEKSMNRPGAKSIDLEGFKRRPLSEEEITLAKDLYSTMRLDKSKVNSLKIVFESLKINLLFSDVKSIASELKLEDVSAVRNKIIKEQDNIE